jgi:hypothetical protein
MNSKPFNPLETGDEPKKDKSGLSMVDVLALPDFEQKLVTWMVRKKKEVSLAEASAYMEQDEDIITTTLHSLAEQGFVQELIVDGERCYRPCLAAKQESRASGKLWQALD